MAEGKPGSFPRPAKPPRRKGRLFGFPLAISERKAMLGILDLLLVNLSLLGAAYLYLGFPPEFGALGAQLGWSLALSVIWLGSALAFDCYDLKAASKPYSSLLNTERALLATALIYLFVPYVIPSRRLITTFFLFASVSLGIWRLLYIGILSQPSFRRRAVVVGAGWAGRTIATAIQRHLDAGYDLVGYIDDDPEKQGQVIEGLPVVGDRASLVSVVEASGADELILAITHNIHQETLRAVMDCFERGVRISLMPLLYEAVTGRVPVEHVGLRWHVALPSADVAAARVDIFLKRLMDIAGALVGLVLLGAFGPFIALALALEARASPLVREVRLGKGGRPFRLLSFRTSRPGVSEPTGMGRVLSASRLDHLPQVLNILRGDMGLVGPRPESPQTLGELEAQIPFYRARQAVRPGLTGWAQVKFRHGGTVEDSLARLQYDLYYIKHQSFYLDVLILLQSLGAVFKLERPGR